MDNICLMMGMNRHKDSMAKITHAVLTLPMATGNCGYEPKELQPLLSKASFLLLGLTEKSTEDAAVETFERKALGAAAQLGVPCGLMADSWDLLKAPYLLHYSAVKTVRLLIGGENLHDKPGVWKLFPHLGPVECRLLAHTGVRDIATRIKTLSAPREAAVTA